MRGCVALILASLLFSACSQPTSASSSAKVRLTENAERYTELTELPRHYLGTFQWDDRQRRQHVEIWFERVFLDEDGETWVALGRGQYRTSTVTAIEIRAHIKPETGVFKMWEANPDSSSFVTNGYHDGRISDDYQRIEATWRGNDGQQGQLQLVADTLSEPGSL